MLQFNGFSRKQGGLCVVWGDLGVGFSFFPLWTLIIHSLPSEKPCTRLSMPVLLWWRVPAEGRAPHVSQELEGHQSWEGCAQALRLGERIQQPDREKMCLQWLISSACCWVLLMKCAPLIWLCRLGHSGKSRLPLGYLCQCGKRLNTQFISETKVVVCGLIEMEPRQCLLGSAVSPGLRGE